MSRHLILVKHALPEKQPAIPAAQWSLSAQGRASCQLLATHLTSYPPSKVFTSYEPKATETAQLLAAYLQLEPPTIWSGLHEHVRDNYYTNDADFQAAVANFFANPTAQVMGRETAQAAQNRFKTAISTLLTQTDSDQNLLVVAHGTVITLFVAAYNSIDAFDFWHSLGLPSLVILSLPEFRLLQVLPKIIPAR